jgi:hypothetical protein
MDVSELRKKILRALDEGRVDAVSKRERDASKRVERDEIQRAYDQFLETVAVPLLKQAQGILKAEGQMFTVHAPAGGAKLASDSSTQTFLEFMLDNSGERPSALGRISRERGRQRVIVDERPIATGKAVAELTEEDVAAFLVAELPKLVGGR